MLKFIVAECALRNLLECLDNIPEFCADHNIIAGVKKIMGHMDLVLFQLVINLIRYVISH